MTGRGCMGTLGRGEGEPCLCIGEMDREYPQRVHSAS